jgi:hypothetical protein
VLVVDWPSSLVAVTVTLCWPGMEVSRIEPFGSVPAHERMPGPLAPSWQL